VLSPAATAKNDAQAKNATVAFGLRRELVRSAYYVAIAALVMAILMWAILRSEDLSPYESGGPIAWFLGPGLLIACFVLYLVHSWRLLIDNTGIHVRFLGRTRSISWPDLASGHVKNVQNTLRYEDPDGVRKSIQISYAYAVDAGIAKVRDALEPRWAAPPIVVPSKPVRVRFGTLGVNPFASVLSTEGIRCNRLGHRGRYGWDDAEWVAIWKHHRLEQGFHKLEIRINGVTLSLVAQPGQTWQENDSAQIEALFRACVSPNKVHTVLPPEQPNTEWARQHLADELRKQLRERKGGALGLFLVFCCLLFVVALYAPWRQTEEAIGIAITAVFLVSILGALYGACWWVVIRDSASSLEALKRSEANMGKPGDPEWRIDCER
jgi:hypothetical protein